MWKRFSKDIGSTVTVRIDAISCFDVLIGYNATSKYSMNAEVTTTDLYPVEQSDSNISLTAELYNNMYVKVDSSCVPKDLAVGDKFVYPYTTVTVVGNETVKDQNGGEHISASAVPTHDAQSFCFYPFFRRKPRPT